LELLSFKSQHGRFTLHRHQKEKQDEKWRTRYQQRANLRREEANQNGCYQRFGSSIRQKIWQRR
jgi:hypothetical protein